MKLANLGTIVLLVALMLDVGFRVNRAHLEAVLKNYGLLVRVFVANFILVPIYGVLLVRAFHVIEPIAAGILLMAICPGGVFVVISAARRKGGSLGLDAVLACLMPALSIVTLPITAYLVLPGNHISAARVGTVMVAFVLVPLLVGVAVNERAPKAAAALQRPLVLVVVLAILFILVILGKDVIASVTSIYGSLGMLTMFCLILAALITGWFLGGPQSEYRHSLAMGTATRHTGLALTIATSFFAGREVAAAVITFFVIQFLTTTLIGIVFKREAEASERR